MIIATESYPRAYRAMVSMQILAELEEVIEYKISVVNSATPASLDIDSARGPSNASSDVGAHNSPLISVIGGK